MAKNILIFFPHQLQANHGGAYSYLYHLQKAFKLQDIHLHFLHELLHLPEEKEIENKRFSFLKNLFKLLLSEKVIHSRRILRYLREKYHDPFLLQALKINFNQYDAIHFHETIDLWRSYHLLRNYRGKIILTSHSPKPYHLELLEDVFGLKRSDISVAAYEKLELIDNFSFSCADIVVAPCREAAIAYGKIWPVFKNLTRGKNWEFIPTGIEVPALQKSPSMIRDALKIKPNAFVVVFNGRHSAVKGFDLLTQAAKSLLCEIDNLYFVVTGKMEGIPAIQHERWIETGWITAPQDYVNAADLIIVPNKQTYFDLNVLLALSLGKPLLLSDTGGNRFFRQFKTEGILYLPSLDVASICRSVTIACKNKEKLAATAGSLKTLFYSQFTLEQFAANYHQFYLSI